VFVSHAGNAGIIPQVLGRGAGQMGVMLFFTLSAFLLTHLYLEKPATKQNVRTFAVARFARVYPLFIAVLSTGLIAHWVGLDRADYPYSIEFRTWLANALLAGRFHVFWTICTEFQFYLLFALMWVAGWRAGKPHTVAFWSALAACLLVFVDIYQYPSGPVFKTLHFFAAGVLAALAYSRLVASRSWTRWADIVLAAALCAFVLSFPNIAAAWGATFNGFWSPWLLALSFVIMIAAGSSHGRLARALGSRTGRLFGDLSFGIYLLHSPVVFYVAAGLGDRPTLVRFAAASFITFALASFSYRFLERPLRTTINGAFSGRKLDGDAAMRQPFLNS